MFGRLSLRHWLIGSLIVVAFLLGLIDGARAGQPSRYDLPEPPAAYVEYRDAALAFMQARYAGDAEVPAMKIVLRPDFRPRGFMVYRTFLGGTVFVTGMGSESRMVCTMVHELTHHFDYYNGRLAQDDCEAAERRAQEMQNLCLVERYDLPPEDVESEVASSCELQAKYSIAARRD